VLGFQAEAVAELILLAGLAGLFAIEEIAAIKLEARLGGEHFHGAAGGRLVHLGGQREFAALVVEHPVMVIAAAEFHRWQWAW
jgi:hypothetical protein